MYFFHHTVVLFGLSVFLVGHTYSVVGIQQTYSLILTKENIKNLFVINIPLGLKHFIECITTGFVGFYFLSARSFVVKSLFMTDYALQVVTFLKFIGVSSIPPVVQCLIYRII